MASILYAWEFGANLGHIGTFLPLARELREKHHEVHWAVTHVHQAARLLPNENFDWLQAPTLPERQREGPPLNYADILLRFGYASATDLYGVVVAWRELIRLTKADLVLADHAPSAILAARSLGVPVMLFGSGFFAPPNVHPTPNMRPWSAVPAQRLLEIDHIAIASINAVLLRLSQAPLRQLADLFDVAETALLSFPELDHYPDRGPAKYWGMLPAAVATPPQWPTASGPRTFAYLRPESAHCGAALEMLSRHPGPVLIYAPDISPQVVQQFASAHLQFASSAVDLITVAQEAAVGVTYASPAATVAFLLAGKPILMIPGHLEQFLFARRVEQLGAGLVQSPEHSAAAIGQLFRRLLNDPTFKLNARAFAERYRRFDQYEVRTNMVARIIELASNHSAAPATP